MLISVKLWDIWGRVPKSPSITTLSYWYTKWWFSFHTACEPSMKNVVHKKNPQHHFCPYASYCVSFLNGKEETLLCKKTKQKERKGNKNATQPDEKGCHQPCDDSMPYDSCCKSTLWSWVRGASIKFSPMCQRSGKGKGQGRTRKLHLYFKTSFHEPEVLWHFKGGCL